MPTSKDFKIKRAPSSLPDFGDLTPFPMRPGSRSTLKPIDWSSPKKPRQDYLDSKRKSPRLRPKFRLRSPNKSPAREPEEVEVYFIALECSRANPSEFHEVNAVHPSVASGNIYVRSAGGPDYLTPCIPEAKGNPVEQMIEWELKAPELVNFRGKYSVCFSEGQKKFYVLRQAKPVDYKGRKIVMYESVPGLATYCANAGYTKWLEDIARHITIHM